MRHLFVSFFAFSLLLSPLQAASVIFIHPDGAGVAAWQAGRFLFAGPDGTLNWDKLPHVGIYRGHMEDCLTASSNGGATAHAYGIKAAVAGFGSDGVKAGRPTAASGKEMSLMHEALDAGLRTALINSGSIIEPGTAAFVASVAKRSENEEIALQVIESGVEVILSGGEQWLLPEGVEGRHGKGLRKDGRDLIALAKEKGYTVVFNREELLAVPAGTRKLLGVFAAAHTFNDMTPADLEKAGLPTFSESAPTIAEMTAKTLELLSGSHFFAVIEEEGTDNFGNFNNARGVFDALKRADDAFGVVLDYIAKEPDTFLITAADSVAGNFDVIGLTASPKAAALVASGRDENGAPFGFDAGGAPFVAAPDKAGKRHAFVVSWGTKHDSSGGIVARAAGKGAEAVAGTVDNSRIYSLMREALFDKK